MNINNLDIIIITSAFIFFRLCWTSGQIDRCQMKIMSEGGRWMGDCLKFNEIFFKVWKWRLRYFRR
jgi:hypothetical protein